MRDDLDGHVHVSCGGEEAIPGIQRMHHDPGRSSSDVPREGEQELLEVAGDTHDLEAGQPVAGLAMLGCEEPLVPRRHVAGLDHGVGDEVVHDDVVEDADPGMAKRRLVDELVPGVVPEVVVHGVVPVRAEPLGRADRDAWGRLGPAEQAGPGADDLDVGDLGDEREQLRGVVGDARQHRRQRGEPGQPHGG